MRKQFDQNADRFDTSAESYSDFPNISTSYSSNLKKMFLHEFFSLNKKSPFLFITVWTYFSSKGGENQWPMGLMFEISSQVQQIWYNGSSKV